MAQPHSPDLVERLNNEIMLAGSQLNLYLSAQGFRGATGAVEQSSKESEQGEILHLGFLQIYHQKGLSVPIHIFAEVTFLEGEQQIIYYYKISPKHQELPACVGIIRAFMRSKYNYFNELNGKGEIVRR